MTDMRQTLEICFILAVLTLSPAAAQFRETNEPPGYLLQWGSYGTGNGQFYHPHGMAVDRSGNIYVIDSLNNRIQKLDSSGNFVTKREGYGTGDGQFDYPWGVTVDVSGNIYVADRYNNRIQKFDGDLNFLAKWGSLGSGDGQFNSPGAVATDLSGNVYVADTSNNRIQKFDSAGNFLQKWGSLGTGDGQFSTPHGVAVDDMGSVYVADSANHRIQKFGGTGNFLTKWGSPGSGDGQFSGPAALAVDPYGNVYILDTFNNRIQKFAPVLWFDVAGYDSYLSVATTHETTANPTLFQLENNGAPRFAFKNTSSDIEWSFQQSGPGNFLISREGTGGPEMQVYQNGRVRMGPGGAINFDLAPNGNLTIAGSLTANGSTFPDYVFGSDYDLMPLEEVGEFVQREKRLPGIPSATEVEQKGGHNMTELQLKLLEKLEELTLFTLEQERRLQQKDGELRQLESDLRHVRRALDSARRPL